MSANASRSHSPSSSARKKLSTYDLVIGLLAILSIIILGLLIFAPLPPSAVSVLNSLELLLCVVFLFDFFRSLFRAQHKWEYVLRGGGWLDLLGSIPLSAFAVFRVARLARVVRVLRTMRSADFRDMLMERLAESTLLFTLLVALVLIFVIAAVVVWAEHGAPGSNIKTYPEAVWWAVVTMTTVGYGDYFPVTTVGRIAAAILMFCGLGIIGVLSSYLATTFITLQARRAARIDAGMVDADDTADKDGKGGEDGENNATIASATTREDNELAAIREELTSLRRLLEARSQTPSSPRP